MRETRHRTSCGQVLSNVKTKKSFYELLVMSVRDGWQGVPQ
jgi:hypothetical protein